MKYYQIAFPGECGQDVVETWSEDQILKSSWYRNWILKMVEANKHDLMTTENAIDDWITVHWAVEVATPEWKTTEPEDEYAYSKEYDADYNVTKNEWVESKCDDPTCEFCANRPERPL